MAQTTRCAAHLSPMNSKPVLINFDGADMSSDAGLTLLWEVERRHDLAVLLASCLDDPRDPSKIWHRLEDITWFRIMMIAPGYEDGNDAVELRHDPFFKISLGRHPEPRQRSAHSRQAHEWKTFLDCATWS